MTDDVVLQLGDVTKTFPGVRALKSVSLTVLRGEVHALLGENGAGKSTLIAVAAGALPADSGSVAVDGVALDGADPRAALLAGIAVVYQHTSVLDDLTVAENLQYAVPARMRAGAGDTASWVAEQLARCGITYDPATRVENLTAAQRQQLEIAKALASSPKVLVLDEPTEALTERESEDLFSQIARIKAEGTAVVYISHRLPEVKRIADRLTVLRDGQVRGTFDAATVSEREILDLIIGRPIDQTFPDKATGLADAATVLSVRGLTGVGIHDVDLDVAAGEIVGLAGVEGNGQRAFLRALAGFGDTAGEVRVRGRSADVSDPAAAQHSGIVYLPGDRQTEGLFKGQSVRMNTSARVLDRISRAGFISGRRERELVDREITRLAIKTPSRETDVGKLSGGNAQKVLFARSLARSPAVLLADEPTRGVDAGARLELYRILRAAASDGSAVVVLSSDAIELQGLADRVLVFSRGEVVQTLTGEQITENAITTAALTADKRRAGAAGRDRHPTRERLRRFLAGDYAPGVILAVLILLLGIITTAYAPLFLGERNLTSMLFLATALAFTSLGQLVVLLTAGVDLAVGPMMGLTVVIFSFFAGQDQGTGQLVTGLLVVLGAAVLVGLVNGALIRFVGLTPVITTVAMSIALLGVALLLRPTPDGYLRRDVTSAFKTAFGPIPAVFIVVVLVTVGMEIVLRRSRFGIGIRAVGSNEDTAHRLGARSTLLIISAYVLCAVLAALGGLVLAAQVAVGDSSVGTNYTLTAISAVVLGGASIFGGRGSFVSALAGVLLIQEISSAIGFLGLGPAWQYALPGILILLAAALYSRSRSVEARRRGGRRFRRRLATGSPAQQPAEAGEVTAEAPR